MNKRGLTIFLAKMVDEKDAVVLVDGLPIDEFDDPSPMIFGVDLSVHRHGDEGGKRVLQHITIEYATTVGGRCDSVREYIIVGPTLDVVIERGDLFRAKLTVSGYGDFRKDIVLNEREARTGNSSLVQGSELLLIVPKTMRRIVCGALSTYMNVCDFPHMHLETAGEFMANSTCLASWTHLNGRVACDTLVCRSMKIENNTDEKIRLSDCVVMREANIYSARGAVWMSGVVEARDFSIVTGSGSIYFAGKVVGERVKFQSSLSSIMVGWVVHAKSLSISTDASVTVKGLVDADLEVRTTEGHVQLMGYSGGGGRVFTNTGNVTVNQDGEMKKLTVTTTNGSLMGVGTTQPEFSSARGKNLFFLDDGRRNGIKD